MGGEDGQGECKKYELLSGRRRVVYVVVSNYKLFFGFHCIIDVFGIVVVVTEAQQRRRLWILRRSMTL